MGIGGYFLEISSIQGKSYSGSCSVVARVTDDIKYSYNNYYDSYSVTAVLKGVKINDEKERNIYFYTTVKDKTQVNPGDVISFESEIENITFFTLGNFQSTAYRDNVSYKTFVDINDISVLENKLTFDERLRLDIKDTLYRGMGDTNGAIAYAVLFGNKDDVDSEIKETFSSAGVIHILTVSGLHVSFLIALIGFVLKKCRVRGWLNFLLCASILGLYAFMCGFSPSIVRAGIMGLVLLTTKISGKCYDNLNSLALSGIIILAFNPLSALDIGFLMSFFCVLGIFIISPKLTKLTRKIFPGAIAESISVSISSQIGVLPFMATIFGNLNFLSVFANLIIIPIFSVLYPLLFISAFATLLMPFMRFLLTICGFGFDIIYRISSFFANTIFSTELSPISIMIVAVVFVAIFLLSNFAMIKTKTRAIICAGLIAICGVFGMVGSFTPAQSGVAYVFYNQNDSLLITNSQGRSAMVDIRYNAKQVMNAVGVDEVSTIFVLDYFYSDIEAIRAAGVQNIVSCNNYRNYDEEVLVKSDLNYKIDGFNFKYIKFDNKVYALEINFDDTSILMLSDDFSKAEHAATLSKENYDFILLGTNSSMSKHFSASSNVLSYEETENCDKNYLQDGNSFYKIKENRFIWRCLD